MAGKKNPKPAPVDQADAAPAAAPPAVPVPAGKRRYVVLDPLECDRVRYAPDDEIDLTDAMAAPLLGHVVRLKDASEEQAAGGI